MGTKKGEGKKRKNQKKKNKRRRRKREADSRGQTCPARKSGLPKEGAVRRGKGVQLSLV